MFFLGPHTRLRSCLFCSVHLLYYVTTDSFGSFILCAFRIKDMLFSSLSLHSLPSPLVPTCACCRPASRVDGRVGALLSVGPRQHHPLLPHKERLGADYSHTACSHDERVCDRFVPDGHRRHGGLRCRHRRGADAGLAERGVPQGPHVHLQAHACCTVWARVQVQVPRKLSGRLRHDGR